MAKGKKRGGERGPTKMIKRIGRMFGRIIGIAIIASPAIRAVSEHLGDPQNIPHHVLFNYTGFDDTTGTFNTSLTASGIGSVVGGVVVMKLISWALR